MYVVPIPSMAHLLVTDVRRRRVLYEQDAKLKARDYLNTDPGRGPVRGLGGAPGRAAIAPRQR